MHCPVVSAGVDPAPPSSCIVVHCSEGSHSTTAPGGIRDQGLDAPPTFRHHSENLFAMEMMIFIVGKCYFTVDRSTKCHEFKDNYFESAHHFSTSTQELTLQGVGIPVRL